MFSNEDFEKRFNRTTKMIRVFAVVNLITAEDCDMDDNKMPEPVAWSTPGQLRPWVARESERVMKLTKLQQPEHDFTAPLYSAETMQALQAEVERLRAERDALAQDAARLNWMDANGFTAYRSIDPIDGLSDHCVVVAETMRPRRGNVADTMRTAIDAAMKEQWR